MSGYSSGNHTDKLSRKYLEDYLCLDINYLNKRHVFAKGEDFSLSWGNPEDCITSITVVVKEDCLEVLYSRKTDNGYGVPCDINIGIAHTRCNYGSRRPWFLCPECGGRVARLYHLEMGFACRKCSKLPYQCQSETDFDRALRKARKIRMVLGADGNILLPVIIPPRGMHWRKFDRLSKKLREAEGVCFNQMAARM